MKIIEQWGSGIPKMINACKEAGLAEPELKEMGGNFRVTVSAGSDDHPSYQATAQATQATQATTQVSLTELDIFLKQIRNLHHFML